MPLSTMSAASSGGVLVGDDDGLGDAVDEVAALHLHGGPVSGHGIGRPQLDLDLFRPPLAHEHVVVLPDVLDDGLVHLVARDTYRLRVHDAGQ